MLDQVESKLNQLQNQQKDEYYKKKNEDLVQWGLSGRASGQKNVPLIVTDEEYESLVDAADSVNGYSKNKIAALLNACSVMIATVGVIVGAMLWIFSENLGFIWFSVAFFASVLLAILFRGVSEAIVLLQQLIRSSQKQTQQIKKSKQSSFPPKQPTQDCQFNNAPPVHYAYPGHVQNNKAE